MKKNIADHPIIVVAGIVLTFCGAAIGLTKYTLENNAYTQVSRLNNDIEKLKNERNSLEQIIKKLNEDIANLEGERGVLADGFDWNKTWKGEFRSTVNPTKIKKYSMKLNTNDKGEVYGTYSVRGENGTGTISSGEIDGNMLTAIWKNGIYKGELKLIMHTTNRHFYGYLNQNKTEDYLWTGGQQ
ncbi:hypothetical protein [Acaryochloris marina]|uniref:hypothetical protein n=1 Tax=Acaryochloris marina TaxID=155978 RepID=UPI0021C26F34|nr:hypothetical protein [Acaryochloris marina]